MGSSVSCSEASGCDASITIPSDSPLAAALAAKPNITIQSTDRAEDEVADTARSNSRPGSPADELSPLSPGSSEKHAMLVNRRRDSGFLGGNVKDYLEGRRKSFKEETVVAPSFQQRTISSGDNDGSESSPGSPNYKKAILGSAEEELLRAARSGKLAAVEQALSLGADVNCTDTTGRTPLFLVSGSFGKGSLDIMELLLKADADIEATDERNWTPMHYACCNSLNDNIHALVTKSASVNGLTSDGRTPVILAIQNCSTSTAIIRTLIEQKADLAVKDELGSSVFWFACQSGYRSAIKLLLKQKSDLNDDSDDGVTPLMIAARKGDVDIGKLLFQYNVDFKAQARRHGNSNALMEAIRYDKATFANWLIDMGSSALPKDDKGQTAADIAEDRGLTQVKARLDQRRRVELGEADAGETAALRHQQAKSKTLASPGTVASEESSIMDVQ